MWGKQLGCKFADGTEWFRLVRLREHYEKHQKAPRKTDCWATLLQMKFNLEKCIVKWQCTMKRIVEAT